MGKTLYQILGVDERASTAVIQKAYERLVGQSYAGRSKDTGDSARYNTIVKAYQILRNPKKRKEYDAQLADERRLLEEKAKSNPFPLSSELISYDNFSLHRAIHKIPTTSLTDQADTIADKKQFKQKEISWMENHSISEIRIKIGKDNKGQPVVHLIAPDNSKLTLSGRTPGSGARELRGAILIQLI